MVVLILKQHRNNITLDSKNDNIYVRPLPEALIYGYPEAAVVILVAFVYGCLILKQIISH